MKRSFRLGDEIAAHRGRHHEQDVGVGDRRIPFRHAAVAEAQHPTGRHGGFDALPDRRSEGVDDGGGG